jgi:hypothetical protein
MASCWPFAKVQSFAWGFMAKDRDEQLPDHEIAERMDRALRRSFQMPHEPHKSKNVKKSGARKISRKKADQ